MTISNCISSPFLLKRKSAFAENYSLGFNIEASKDIAGMKTI